MKKTISLMLAASVCSTFSFYKMSDVVLFECQSDNYVNVPNDQELKDNTSYKFYVYNQQLKYGIQMNSNYLFPRDYYFNNFGLLKRRIFDRTWWENYFISNQSLHIELEFFKTNLSEAGGFEVLNNQIQSKKRTNVISLGYLLPFFSQPGITSQHIKGINISFEKAFKKYVRSHSSSYGEQLLEDVLKLNNDLKNPIPKLCFTNILKKSKMIFSEQEKELLDNSEILAVWALDRKECSNKKYVEEWNERHKDSKDHKKAETKCINRIIMGFAVDKRDNTTFHWVTDLGQDISVLFDSHFSSIF